MVFRFGSYELDEENGQLLHDGRPVAVQPKPLALLVLLLRERHRVVPSEELFERLWPGTAVTPSSLTRAVSHARRAVGDTHRGGLIRSFARRGYRFCGDVVEIDRAAPAAAASAAPAGGVPFVGRDAALAALRAGWDEAVEGRATTVLVSGPPGIGKTRLSEVFAADTERRGGLVLTARCRDGEGGAPAFWLWAQVLRQLLRSDLVDDELRGLVHRSAELGELDELASLVPPAEASRARGAQRLSPDERRFHFFDAVTGVLGRASRRRPILLVLEDVQWARPASLRLLEHLAFEARDACVLVVATLRDEPRERGHPVNRTVAILGQQDGCRQVPLGGFSRAEVAQLLERVMGRPAPADLTSELFARTEGVPLFLREAIRLLDERGDLRDPDRIPSRGVALPAQAIGLIRRAYDDLSERCAELTGAAAVIGREFTLPFVAEIADVPRDAALDLLDEAGMAGIVEPVEGVPAGYRFTHALFRDAAYQDLSEGRRARLHHRAARRLERQHADDPTRVIAELAHHHSRGMAVGDPERAFECARLAAERAASLLAHEQAADHYEQALAALDACETVDPTRRLEMLLALGEAYLSFAERRRRRDVFQQAMEAARALGRTDAFARAALGFCDLSEWSPPDPRARAALEEAFAALGDDGADAARVATRLAYLDVREPRHVGEPMARRAVEMARKADDPTALQEALYTLHYVLAGPQGLDERASITREIAELSSHTSWSDVSVIALLDIACDRIELGDAEGAREFRAEAARVAGQSPPPSVVWHIQVYDTGIAALEGRLDEVERRAHDAFLVGQRIGHPFARGCYDSHRVGLARERGDAALVEELFSPILDRSAGDVQLWLRALVARAGCAMGRPDAARSVLDSLAADDFDAVLTGIRFTNSLLEVAALCADLGDAERARTLVERLAPFEHHHGVLPIPVCYGGPMSFQLARLHELLGRTAEAVDLYQDALDSTEALGARPMHARVASSFGALLLRTPGQKRRGSELLEASRRAAEELGLALPIHTL